MKFDELIKRLLEDYNYDFTSSGRYQTGTVQASSKDGILRPLDGGLGGANQPIGRGLFPQKKDYIVRNKTKKKKK